MSEGRIEPESTRTRTRNSRQALPAAMAPYKWQPGQSGNPGGLGGKYAEAMKLARKHSVEAVRRLVELMGDEDGRVAAVACQSIWEKAWGKREPPPDHGVPEQQLDLSQLSVPELKFLLKLVRSGAVRAIEPPSDSVTDGDGQVIEASAQPAGAVERE